MSRKWFFQNVDVKMHLSSIFIHILGGVWGEWSTWSTCSQTCGRGSHTRNRLCENPNNGPDCVGDSSETKTCNRHRCPTRNSICYPLLANVMSL